MSATDKNAEPQARILLAMPSYDAWCSHGARVSAHWCTTKHHVSIASNGTSLIPLSFGLPWCDCLNNGFTHFAMLHADIEADKGWIDTLVDEMERVSADLISVVVPQKNMTGLTSTAVEPYGQWGPRRRFMMREIFELPETFDNAACGYPEAPLLVNTGCWVARVRDVAGGPIKPWAAEFPGFQILSRIAVNPVSNKHEVRIDPEDWNLSRYCHARGVRVFATRKVRVQHEGTHHYRNTEPWGSRTTDDPYWDDVSVLVERGEIINDHRPRPDALSMSQILETQGV